MKVAVLVVGEVALHTVTSDPTVPTVVAWLTVISIVFTKVSDWQVVVVLVILVNVTAKPTLGLVVLVKVGVVNVNVPEPVPATPVKATVVLGSVFMVPVTDHPWVEATLATVML